MYRFGALVLLSLSLAAQEPDTGITFSTTTKLVIVDVFVRNRAGKALDSLKKEDFTILENGKPQQISVFDFQRLGSETPPSEAPAVQSPKPAAPARANAIRVDSPGKVQYQDKRLLVLFFDFSSMQPQEQIRAQQAALKFLTEQMTPSDMVAIMTLGAGVQVAQNFTNDRDLLARAIKGFHIGDASELSIEADTGDANSGEYTGAAFIADETEFNIFNTDRKLMALETAVRMLAPLPEKKAIVYFTSGFPRPASKIIRSLNPPSTPPYAPTSRSTRWIRGAWWL